jgi:plasmid maintenance system antidote protein VapI
VTSEIHIIKGIHPGFILERKLKERRIRKGKLALAIGEYPQTLTSITKGRRGMNTSLSLKLEKFLGLEEGYFMILQAYHDIKLEKQKQAERPDLGKFRSALFWDTDMESLDWQRQFRAIISRVMERGNDQERSEIIRFYGDEKIRAVMDAVKTD